MQVEINGIIYHDELAEVAENITDEKWAFFDLVDSITDQIYEFMVKNNVSKADLARRTKRTRANVSQLLGGDTNMTLKSLAGILHHIGAKADVKITAFDDPIVWLGKVPSKKKPLKSNTHWGKESGFDLVSSCTVKETVCPSATTEAA